MDPSEEVMRDDERLHTYPSPDADGQQDAGSFFSPDTGQRNIQHSDMSNDSDHQVSNAASVEELQLAAQLGQDLAAEPMITMADQGIKFDEAALRTIMPHPDDQTLRHISHPDHHSTRPYIPIDPAPTPPPAPPPSQISIALGQGLAHSLPAAHALSNTHEDGTPPRKRSKVSRACDECRRKKVKCDASTDTGDTPCSNCKRSSQRCSFSRIPQKRGPSKGYIKELADRINSIEGRLGDTAGFPNPSGEGIHGGRKRALSGVSNGSCPQGTASTRAPAMSWNTELQHPPQPSPTSERLDTTYQTSGLAPQPINIKPDTPPKPPTTGLEGMAGDAPELAQPRDLDDEVFNGYKTMIHPYLPILPSSKPRLQVYLAQCSGMLREAFLEALSGTMHSFPSFTSSMPGDVGLAKKMLMEWELNDDAPRTQAAHIVHLQSIVLLLIEADVRPSGSVSGQKESLLGRAVGTAWALRLHQLSADCRSVAGADADVDADVRIRLKLWWSLVVLDRWTAVSMGIPTMTHRRSAIAQGALPTVLGEVPWLLLRLSKVMERIAAVLTCQQANTQGLEVERVLAAFLDDYVENFREDLPGHIDPLGYPVVHLTYWHCRLVAYLLDPSVRAMDLLWPCRETVAILLAVPRLVSPFQHHFRAVVMLTLAELARADKTRDEASKLLGDLRKLPISTAVSDGIIGDRIVDMLAQAGSSQALLQQLAEVAASSSLAIENDKREETPTPPRPDDENICSDLRRLLTSGYFKFVWASNV